ncbi:hypothetical protein [Dyella subtropica]|uniref:hypothetical protein n=1 Tax=Dyella subtropica TaxID=2992127 RepID=UPI002257D472|nr:hypothetical protein [Dyella subtropica]
MNRILQADVILTLTFHEADAVLTAVDGMAEAERAVGKLELADAWVRFAQVLREECARQGVQL